MYNIAKNRVLRSRHWLVILLVLTTFSLTSHYVADAVHLSAGTCWSCGIQKLGETRQTNETAHTNELHRHLLLNERSSSGIQPARQTFLGPAIYPGFGWILSTPVRPPIIL